MDPIQTNTVSNVQMAEEAYNRLMSDIEFELRTDVYPFLEEIYGDETEEDKELREEWYENALELFRDRLNDMKTTWMTDVRKEKHEKMQGTEKRAKQSESKELSDIEQSFNS